MHIRVCKKAVSRHNSHLKQTASILLAALAAALLLAIAGCGKDPATMTDAELGLNAEQARGRRVYNLYCLSCHPAYSTHGNKGPGLRGMYSKPYLPSGLTATDEHVIQSIVQGRGMMPRFGDSVNQRELQDMIAYLHTL
jgi:mono/diheme cytochrome c family protein